MAAKLRIAVWYNLASGGAKRSLHDHVSGLKAQGHTVEAWRPPVAQEDYLSLSRLVEEHTVPLSSVDDGRNYLDRVARHLVRQSRMREAMRNHAEQAAQEINRGGFDVLFANPCMQFHSPWIGRFIDLPKLLYLAEPKRPFYEAMPTLPWLALPDEIRTSWRLKALKQRAKDAIDNRNNRIQARDESLNAQSFDRILCNSNFSRESILRAYNLEAQVCYLGIDTSLFQSRNELREPFVISVGSFGPAKRPEFIVRAVASIRQNRPRLIWVANTVDATHRAQVEALAQELEVDLQIRQYVPDTELLDLLNRATAMAYAPRLEPFGYAPLEANACGCPAVVVSEGGVKESIRDGVNGMVVAPHPDAMGEALEKLLTHPDRAQALGQSSAEHVRQHWTLEKATDELERNLREVIEMGQR